MFTKSFLTLFMSVHFTGKFRQSSNIYSNKIVTQGKEVLFSFISDLEQLTLL